MINSKTLGVNQTSKETHDLAHKCGIPFTSALVATTLRDYIRKRWGIYIEMIIDGAISPESDIVSDEFICYRTFVWKVGSKRPHHNSDIGAGEYNFILDITFQHILSTIIKTGTY